jgi:hypothetical protein
LAIRAGDNGDATTPVIMIKEKRKLACYFNNLQLGNSWKVEKIKIKPSHYLTEYAGASW